MKRYLIASAAAMSAAAVTAVPSEALAGNCSDLTNPIYVAGSSAIQSTLAKMAPILAAGTPSVTLVYANQGSCVGMDEITNGTAITATPLVVWDNTGTAIAGGCANTTHAADVGVSDVYPTSCPNITVPAGKHDFGGPIQSMNFVVPAASTETSISAEAAYTIFGYGGTTYQVAPWTTLGSLIIRNQTSGTQQMLAAAIGLAASKWKGTDGMSSGGVLTGLAGLGTASTGLGILASGAADPVSHGVANASIKILAYQHTGQKCGYLPDSSASTYDKINVRQGRYAVWGPVHFVTAVDGQGVPSNANVKAFINAVTGVGLTSAQLQTVIDAEAAAHVVPQCAMQVSRTSEVGAEASYQADVPCGCYFESKVGTASAACTTCTTDANCTMGNLTHCRYGYCEAK